MRESLIRGFCNTHYARMRNTGELQPLVLIRETLPYSVDVPCGTPKGYDRHRVKGEDPCAECKESVVLRTRTRSKKITPEIYEQLLAAQGYKCAICGTDSPSTGKGVQSWHIDHDHECCPGQRTCGRCTRGLLCFRCNVGLGHFRDDPDLLHDAIVYLSKYSRPSANPEEDFPLAG